MGGRWRVWVLGARPRTLGAAIAPVLVGTAAAHSESASTHWDRGVLALVVTLGMQVGVNYANDYSDGVRGTDRDRTGPVRLTASGLASPAAVKRAAIVAFTVGALAGLGLAYMVSWWILAVGAASIAAGVGYTGGPKPYGYLGLGEVMVLVFFGFVATAGSAYVQVEFVPSSAWWGSLAVGLLACAILLANNIRDIASDSVVGKRTLAVRVGARVATRIYVGCVVGSFGSVVAIGVVHPLALVALIAAPLAVEPLRLVLRSPDAPALVRVLVATSRLELVVAVLLGAGLWLS